MRLLAVTVAVLTLSGCGDSQPADRHFVSPVLLKRGMTFTRVRELAGPPRAVIRRAELVRVNGQSPFSQVWVYTEPAPSTARTYVYFSPSGRALAVLRSTGKPVSF